MTGPGGTHLQLADPGSISVGQLLCNIQIAESELGKFTLRRRLASLFCLLERLAEDFTLRSPDWSRSRVEF